MAGLPASFTASDSASFDLEGCVSSVLSVTEGDLLFFFRILSIENGFASME